MRERVVAVIVFLVDLTFLLGTDLLDLLDLDFGAVGLALDLLDLNLGAVGLVLYLLDLVLGAVGLALYLPFLGGRRRAAGDGRREVTGRKPVADERSALDVLTGVGGLPIS